MKKRLITSALPYVNNIPHLGNLIQVLSADVFARFCRLKGYDTLYVCGTDEYGTATETKAIEEGITPKELCDRYYTVHDEIYKWFEISFDRFGRTSTPAQTEIVQDIFLKLDAAGYINEKTTEQLYCSSCDRFLADRYVRGTCPHCGYEDARGDQCENCGKLLDPVDLINPRCGVCHEPPVLKATRHLYIDLPAILPKLEAWMDRRSKDGFWANNAVQMTKSWIRDGLHERCITRDLKWGIPVPRKGFEDKVFYVWFDAPIGYISITANHTDDWEAWWKNPDEVELFQFIGKDNIPFHTVIFPSSLLGSGDNWTTLWHMSSTEYLNYETGKFSKSKGVGVFGTDARDTGISADVWRFYIYYNRPEKSDALFSWSDMQTKVNSELIGNFGNLVNRTLTFLNKFYDGSIPEAEIDAEFWKRVTGLEETITAHLERAELKEGLKKILELSSIGNKAFQDGEPWRTRTENPEQAAVLLKTLAYLVRDLSLLMEPYTPAAARKVRSFLGIESVSWKDLGTTEGLSKVTKPELLFSLLEDDLISQLRDRFAGTQKDRETMEKDAHQGEETSEAPEDEKFIEKVDLRVAKITGIERHPEADKLYIETLDAGEEQPRQIVSGLVPYYSEEDLLNRNIILVSNLKPAKLRGVKSQGMLLAAEEGETVEVLFADDANPGDPVVLEGEEPKPSSEYTKLKIDHFFEIPMTVEESTVFVGGRPLKVAGRKVTTTRVKKGKVG
jgi:methionyl-tRNA synthetase